MEDDEKNDELCWFEDDEVSELFMSTSSAATSFADIVEAAAMLEPGAENTGSSGSVNDAEPELIAVLKEVSWAVVLCSECSDV